MSRRLAVAVVLWCCAVFARADTRGAVDWIFLVDTSKSMVVETKVFGEVKESLRTFVREASPGDTVTIYTFDDRARHHTEVTVEDDRRGLFRSIDDLEAKGNRTHLGAAIQQGLDYAANLPLDATRTRAIVLFTDGKEDVRGIQNPVPIPANVQLAKDTFVFFVSLGEHEEKLNAFGKAKVFRPTRDAIRQVAADIRTTIKTVERPSPKLAELPPASPPPPEPSITSRIAKIVAAIVLLAILAFVARSKLRNARLLEGEIEIVKPAVGDAAFVGLPTLNETEVALSAIVPPDVLAGSDARLFCRRKEGVKTMWIAAASGSLRVNDVEVPEHQLFDADVIRIGDATLRFNDNSRPRPQEDLS